MKRFIFFVLSIFLVFCLMGCQKLEYKEQQVEATVIDKRHRSGYSTKVGKTTIYHSAKNYVKLKYNDFEDEVNSKTLYNSVEKDAVITVIYVEGKNEDGIIKRQYFKLIE